MYIVYCSTHILTHPHTLHHVTARVPKKVLQMAGIEDVYTASRGCSKTLGNFVKATFQALSNTYGFLSPELWKETKFTKAPFQEHTDFLANPHAAHAAAPKQDYAY